MNAFWDTVRVRRLAIRPGAIGDFIASLPALESLKCEYLEVWTGLTNAVLAQFADKARAISSTGLDLLGIGEPPSKLVEELRAFDSIVSWYGANRPEFIELTRQLGLKITFLRALPAAGAGVHGVDFYLDQVRGIAARSVEPVPRLRFEDVQHGDYAVIHPFSGSPKKNWPLGKFEAMARKLSRAMPVHWCAGPEDPPLERLIEPRWQVVRMDDLASLGRWLAGARLYVGNDSGITHLAAAAGAPVLAMFGPASDAATWAPRGDNVRVAFWK